MPTTATHEVAPTRQGEPTTQLTAGREPVARSAAADAPVPAPAPGAQTPSDLGIFEELHPERPRSAPRWLAQGPNDVWRQREGAPGWVLVSGVPVAVADANAKTTVRGSSLQGHDLDGDGIPDAYDILLGAKKVALNSAVYLASYLGIGYPGGDVPRDIGVCTDVVVRALRNAGIDLQKEIHEDAAKHPAWYPAISKPDANIDQRRVKNALAWFTHHWQPLSNDGTASPDAWLPGDIVFFDTLPAAGPDHLGIISDEVSPAGVPLVINNWTEGYHESAMDLLGSVPVTHRFRVPSAVLPVAKADAGLGGLLARHGLAPGSEALQLVLVVTPVWNHNAARLYRYERASFSEPFQPVAEPWTVRLGASGLGTGLGLHNAGFVTPNLKQEGDRRSPAGLFELGTAFGPDAAAPGAARWPWRQTRKGDVFVDDPKSSAYNEWRVETAKHDWDSREDLTSYQLGIVVEHNDRKLAGRGSAIFIHSIPFSRPTTGCTGLLMRDMATLVGWLSPEKHPVLAQVAGALYDAP